MLHRSGVWYGRGEGAREQFHQWFQRDGYASPQLNYLTNGQVALDLAELPGRYWVPLVFMGKHKSVCHLTGGGLKMFSQAFRTKWSDHGTAQVFSGPTFIPPQKKYHMAHTNCESPSATMDDTRSLA